MIKTASNYPFKGNAGCFIYKKMKVTHAAVYVKQYKRK